MPIKYIIIQIMMKQTTKNWNDFSDDDSEPLNSDSDEQNLDDGNKKQQQGNQREVDPSTYTFDMVHGNMIWLQAVISGSNAKELKERVFDLKKRDEKIKVFLTERDKIDALDVLIYKDEGKDLIEKGLDSCKEIRFSIHKRNFERPQGERNNRGDRGDRRGGRGGDRREGRGGGRGRGGDRGGDDRRKPKYVDKETGKQSDNRKKLEERMLEQKDRVYTKKQVNQIGAGFANFRNKPLEERRKQIYEKEKEKEKEDPKPEGFKSEERKQRFKPPREKQIWKRKTIEDEKAEEAARLACEPQKQKQTFSTDFFKKKTYKEREHAIVEENLPRETKVKGYMQKKGEQIKQKKDQNHAKNENEGENSRQQRPFQNKNRESRRGGNPNKKYIQKHAENGKIEQKKTQTKTSDPHLSQMMSDDSDN